MNIQELLNRIFQKKPEPKDEGMELYRQALAILYSPEHDAIMDRLDTELMRRPK